MVASRRDAEVVGLADGTTLRYAPVVLLTSKMWYLVSDKEEWTKKGKKDAEKVARRGKKKEIKNE